jgi:thioredoxin 1
MTTLELTEGNVEDTLKGDGIVLIDWWASWCGPCRSFAPVYEAAAERHPDITFAKVDTEAEQALAGSAGIRSIPTIMAFRDGIMVFRQAGALPDAVLEDLIGQIRGLDMDEVKASITQAPADAAAEA